MGQPFPALLQYFSNWAFLVLHSSGGINTHRRPSAVERNIGHLTKCVVLASYIYFSLFNDVECETVMEYLRERGIYTERKGVELVVALVGSLRIGFWCPRDDFPTFDDVDDLKKVLGIDSLDVLVVVSYRPYVLVDYLSSLLERAHRWYGVRFDVKLLGISSVDIETGLEEALGRAMVERPHKLGGGVKTDCVCPQCTREYLRLYRQEKFFSRKYRGRVVESIYGCPACNFRARRVELLD